MFQELLRMQQIHKADVAEVLEKMKAVDAHADFAVAYAAKAGLKEGAELLVTQSCYDFFCAEGVPEWYREKLGISVGNLCHLVEPHAETIIGDDMDDGMSFAEYFIGFWIDEFMTSRIPITVIIEMRQAYLEKMNNDT